MAYCRIHGGGPEEFPYMCCPECQDFLVSNRLLEKMYANGYNPKVYEEGLEECREQFRLIK